MDQDNRTTAVVPLSKLPDLQSRDSSVSAAPASFDSDAESSLLGPNPQHLAPEPLVGQPLSWQQFAKPNKWERLVRPDRFTLTDENLLRKTPYIINSQYNALICLQCKHAVSPDSAASHARKEHGCRTIVDGFDKALILKYPFLVSEAIQPTLICDPIFGLAISSDPYTICARCRRGYANSECLRKHHCKNADFHVGTDPPHFSSLVQTFFQGNRLCYFPIRAPTINSDVQNDFALFKAQSACYEDVDKICENANYREMQQFLCREGWIKHVASCTTSKLMGLVLLPGPTDPLSAIAPHLRILFTNIQTIISQQVFHVRRLLGRQPS